ncbi:MAG: diguanylate cyclase [Fimbriimonadales bacterium]
MELSERDRAENQHWIDVAVNASPEEIIVLDREGTVLGANPAARKWLGPNEHIWRHPDVVASDVLRETLEATVRTGQPCVAEQETDGRWFEWRGWAHPSGFAVQRKDISERKREEAGLQFQLHLAQEAVAQMGSNHQTLIVDSERDGLTNLNNRRRYDEFANSSFGLSKSKRTTWAVTVIDVDHFKSFNDQFGHEMGDQVLKRVADCLREDANGHEFIARYGGEEFVVVSTGMEPEMVLTRAELLRRRIEATQGFPRELTASLGVAFKMTQDHDPATVFSRADAALYVAKDSGRNRVHVHPKDGRAMRLDKWSYRVRAA